MKLESRVEILKLARLLDAPPERFAYLESVPPQDLRRLRERSTDRLFDADGQALQRIAAASRLLPTGVAASIGQRAFGPLLCARIAGRLDPGRGVDLAARLPAEFLADVAVELDPRRASDIIVRIPTGQIVDVTRVLVRRGEHVAMGRFVGHLDDETILAALEVIDDESLLRIVFVLEAKQRVSHVAGLLSDDRLRALVRAAAKRKLWAEALNLITQLHKPLLRRLAALPEVDDPKVIDPLVRTAIEEDVWQDLLPLVELLPESARARVEASLPAR